MKHEARYNGTKGGYRCAACGGLVVPSWGYYAHKWRREIAGYGCIECGRIYFYFNLRAEKKQGESR